MTYHYYDFFAGGGMAGVGLGRGWKCAFANDFNAKKADIYRRNNKGGAEFVFGDVESITPPDLPGQADLAWASFPCQDMSLAGARQGLRGGRSGAFWPFWTLMQKLGGESRAPRLIVLENVCGALTSHDGADFTALSSAFAAFGYRFGAVVIDARHFVPQSRPRLFVIGVRGDLAIPSALCGAEPSALWHPAKLVQAARDLPRAAAPFWTWWDLPAPPKRNTTLASIIEEAPGGVAWRDDTDYLLSLMAPAHLEKVNAAKRVGHRVVGTVFRRTRTDGQGRKKQRAEVRFDDLSGCLRTPSGGSSRQIMLFVDGETVRSRLLSPREAARLMGLPEDYQLPDSTNAALHLAGDGVAPPVVRHIAAHLLEPILTANDMTAAA
jgi:DNA (cytosine-5)-methyltransferase 1